MNVIGAIILTCFLLSLFNTISLLFFNRIIDRSHKFFALTVSSIFTTISLFVLYFDIIALADGSMNLIATFLTFLSLATALVILVRTILMIHDNKNTYPIKVYIIFVAIAASLITLSTYTEISILRSISYYLIVTLPFITLLKKHFLKNKINKRSFVFYQTITILIIASFNLLFLIAYRISNPQGEIPIVEVISSVIIAIIQISMYLTIVLEVVAKDKQDLDNKNLILEMTYQRIKKVSETDELTDLFNRRKINSIIEAHFQNSINLGSKFSLILLDVDNFKSINDLYGHNEGDRVLQFLSNSLRNVLRSSDFIGRWGGDEFIALLPSFNESNVSIVVNKINNYFIDNPYINPDIVVSVSIGISNFSKGKNLEEMIHEADEMMYKNKNMKKTR